MTKAKSEKRTRNVCMTWNNPGDKVPEFNAQKMDYLIYQFEVGKETGTPHWQMYCEFKNAHTFKAIQKIMGGPVSCHPRDGTAKQASDYCEKQDGTQAESPTGVKGSHKFGEMSKQGERVDLNVLNRQLATGETTVREIMRKMPSAYHQYGRTLLALEDNYRDDHERTEMTKGIWITGKTGVGKSHDIFQKYKKNDRYVKVITAKDVDWWDAYRGQPVVIFNDFRGEIKYNEMLNLIDKWPHMVSRRGREPTPFMAQIVIITSPMTPQRVYRQQNERDDSIEQLLRRITIFTKTNKKTIIELPDILEIGEGPDTYIPEPENETTIKLGE